MGAKRQPIIIEKKDVRVFLAARMASMGGGMAALAEMLGVTMATAYDLVSGELTPNDEILRKAGLRPVYVLEAEVPEPSDAPKRKK
jgi:hypothetical protein